MAMPRAKDRAVVTLVTTDNYLPGALVALRSLLDAEGAAPSPTSRSFATVALVTPATVGHGTVTALQKAFDIVIGVEQILSESLEELKLLGRRDLAASLTKLHLFRLTQYEKVVFLDADTLVLRPISPLLDLPHRFAAAPDVGWPDAFNSGVFVAEPSMETFDGLLRMMRSRGSWDGGDQGLLNDYFSDWHRLSFTYNVTPSAYYTYAPAYRRHGQDVAILHFIGAEKPWHRGTRDAYDPDAASKDYYGLTHKWFDVFERHFGAISTYDVASRVVAPPSFLSQALTSLPPLPVQAKPSLEHQADGPAPSTPPTPTISVAPPSPPRSHESFTTATPTATTPLAIPSARAASPPHLTWDPARSSPPRNGPPQMRDAVPYAPNIWDSTSRREMKKRFEPPARYPEPPKETHDWYKEVMSKKPDPSQVKPVFPWEQAAAKEDRPVTTPGGTATGFQFGSMPPPPPTRTFSDEGPASSAGPSAASGSFAHSGPGTFVNAWDSVPAIKRYASSLAKRQTGHSRRISTEEGKGGPQSGGLKGGSSTAVGGANNRRRSGSAASSLSITRNTDRRDSGPGPGAAGAVASGATAATAAATRSPRPSSVYSKDEDASSRDGDDEEDEDADGSTATDDCDDDEEPEDSEEGIDRIQIKFRRAVDKGELSPTNRRSKKSNSPSSTEEAADTGVFPPRSGQKTPTTASGVSAPTSPTRARKDSRYVPTSPRQPRSPHYVVASPAAFANAAQTSPRQQLRLQMPVSPASGALSPRLAAQALRNSTAARLTASGSGTGDAPPLLRATRVFSPDTDTGVVKQQGLAALQRFVENMEQQMASQGHAYPQQQQVTSQQEYHPQQQQQQQPPFGGGGSGGAFRW